MGRKLFAANEREGRGCWRGLAEKIVTQCAKAGHPFESCHQLSVLIEWQERQGARCTCGQYALYANKSVIPTVVPWNSIAIYISGISLYSIFTYAENALVRRVTYTIHHLCRAKNMDVPRRVLQKFSWACFVILLRTILPRGDNWFSTDVWKTWTTCTTNVQVCTCNHDTLSYTW